MLRHGRGQEYVYTLPRGDNTQNFVFLRIISFAFAIFEMLKTAFCVRQLIINSINSTSDSLNCQVNIISFENNVL